MIDDHMLAQMHEVATWPNTETETYVCPCGKVLKVIIDDDSPLLASEQRAGQLDGAGWIVSEGVTCPDCEPAWSHMDEVDQLADYEREQERL